jgi:hypothetical protein
MKIEAKKTLGAVTDPTRRQERSIKQLAKQLRGCKIKVKRLGSPGQRKAHPPKGTSN